MGRLIAISFAMLGLALPVQATEWLICSSADGKASFGVLAGSLGIGTASDFQVTVGDKSWSTKEGEGTRISKLQSYEDERMVLATVADADMAKTVAELRVYKASEGDSLAQGGVLIVAGEGAWAVSCPNE